MSCFETLADSIVWRGGGETLTVQAWGPDGLRVRARRTAPRTDDLHALLPVESSAPAIAVDGETATLQQGRITAVLTARTLPDESYGHARRLCALEFRNERGEVLLREIDPGGSLKLAARHYRSNSGGGNHRITAAFEPPAGEKLYGMGQYQQAILDLKGSTLELAHRNSQASVPFVLSSAGYGFLWHNPAIGRATFATNRTEWVAEASSGLDYWITAGDTPAEITAAYAEATGHVPMMPEFGLGFWQCKLRYWNQEQLLEVAREHRRRDLPMDVIVADFFHWPRMGDYRFDPEFWPDPKAMVDELAELGIELMVSVWPQVSMESENFEEFDRRGHLVRVERGMDVQMAFQGPSMFLDTTDPDARAHLWEICKRNYHDLGVRLFWLDEAEPEFGAYDFDNYRYHLGPTLEVGNLYPQAFSRAFYEGQLAAGQSEIVNLVRCAWAGSQRYGALVWSGDIHSTFEDLRRQITAGIHMGVAGIPWFTTDIGGFHDGDITDPNFHDLLIRWFQFGTFCPVMRLHGDRRPTEPVVGADGIARCPSGADNDLWSFGDDVYAILTAYVRLREQLRDYTREVMADAHRSGQPVMRGLFHDFPHDPLAWEVADQFLFGPDILVAPVVRPHAEQREVYLPDGASWRDLHTGAVHDGGATLTVPAPAHVIPVFIRSGALPGIRLGPV